MGSEQLSFSFDVPRAPSAKAGALALDSAVRDALRAAIRASGLPREEIARRMSAATGRRVTRHQLNTWTAASRRAWQFPFHLAPAFEAATGSRGLLDLFAASRGCRALAAEEVLLADLGRMERDESLLRKRKRELKRLVAS